MQTKPMKKIQRVIGFAGFAFLLAILPIGLLNGREAYDALEQVDALTVLGTAEAPELQMPEGAGPWAGGKFLVQLVAVDTFTRTPLRAWSKELSWPEASNQVHEVTFPGQAKTEKLTIRMESLKWRWNRNRDEVPHWQRKALNLDSQSFTDVERSDDAAGLSGVIAYDHIRGRSGRGSGSRGIYSGQYRLLLSMPSKASTGRARQMDWLVAAIVPLGGDTKVTQVSVEAMMPDIQTALAGQEKIHLNRDHRVDRPAIPLGFSLMERFNVLFILGCIGCMWACGLFRRPMIALACLAMGLVFYLGVIDRIRSANHLQKVENVELPAPQRMVAASLAGQSFFHMGMVSDRLLALHDEVVMDEPGLARAILDRAEILRGKTLDPDKTYLDDGILMKMVELDDPATYEEVFRWADASPLRSYQVSDGQTFYNNTRQILTCTTNRMGLIWQSRSELIPMRQLDLPSGIRLESAELLKEHVLLDFSIDETLARQTGVAAGESLRARFELEELFGDEHSDYDRMAFSKPGAPDPIRDFVNVLMFLKRAGHEPSFISPIRRTMEITRDDMDVILRVELPFECRVAIMPRDPGTVQIQHIFRQDPHLSYQATIYSGDDPGRIYRRLPDEHTVRNGRFTWQEYTYGTSNPRTYLRMEHELDSGKPLIILVTGNEAKEREILFEAFDAMEILPR